MFDGTNGNDAPPPHPLEMCLMNVLKFCVCAAIAAAVTFAGYSTTQADPVKKPAAAKEAKKDGAKKDGAKKGKKPAGKREKGANKGKRGPGAQLANAAIKRLAKADLTAEQKSKIQALAATHGAKMAEVRKAAGLTKEQQTARQEAMKKARADGKKGKELRDAVTAAVKMTDEQQAAMTKAGAMQKEYYAAVMKVLTPEQKAALKPARKPGKKKKEAA